MEEKCSFTILRNDKKGVALVVETRAGSEAGTYGIGGMYSIDGTHGMFGN